MANKLGDEKGFFGEYSASDLCTMAEAKELPELEALYVEKLAEVNGLEVALHTHDDSQPSAYVLQLKLEYRAEAAKLARLKQRVDFAANCAKYVRDTLKREPWKGTKFPD